MLLPRSVLLGYMKDMNEWEKKCAYREHQCDQGELDYNTAAERGSAEYMKIFAKYCSREAMPRDYFFTEPPDYDPEGETIVNEFEVRPGLVEIRTQQDFSHRKKHVFRIVLENGEWKIIERKILLDTNEILDTSL